MSYKVVQKEDKPKQYATPIQNKIDKAAEFGTVYILNDEDNRVQALYNNPSLTNEEIIRQVDRVRSPQDGKEYIVVGKTVTFYNRDTGVYVDKYVYQEGVLEEPIVTTNDKGEQVANQTAVRYTIPFSTETSEEYLNQANGNLPLTFYDGITTSTRLIRNKTLVGNADYFKEASWNELLLGKESKLVSSMVNTLDQVREIGDTGIRNSNRTYGNIRHKPNPVDQDRTTINYENTSPSKPAPQLNNSGIVQNVDTLKINAANQGLEKGSDYTVETKSNVAPTDGIPNKVVNTSNNSNDEEEAGTSKNNTKKVSKSKQ